MSKLIDLELAAATSEWIFANKLSMIFPPPLQLSPFIPFRSMILYGVFASAIISIYLLLLRARSATSSRFFESS